MSIAINIFLIALGGFLYYTCKKSMHKYDKRRMYVSAVWEGAWSLVGVTMLCYNIIRLFHSIWP